MPCLALASLIVGFDASAVARLQSKRQPRADMVYSRQLSADASAIAPFDLATASNDLFDRHGGMPMTADIGDCLFIAMEIDKTYLAAPGYQAGMGFGVPFVIGVATTGLQPLILVGDSVFR